MRDLRWIVALLLLAPALLHGCLAGTGTAAGLLGTSDGGSDGGGSPPEIAAPVLDAPVIPLPGTPVGLIVGDFFGAGGLPDGVQDVAVMASDLTVLSILEGDGEGGFKPPVDLDLGARASLAQDIAKVDRPGELDIILVAAQSALFLVTWSESRAGFVVTGTVALDFEQDRRQIAVGDFDGDGVPDAAVSGRNTNTISVLRGNDSGELYELSRRTQLTSENPVALASANFDADRGGSAGLGRSDLVVLEDSAAVPTLRLLLSSDSDELFVEQSRLEEGDLLTTAGASIHARDGATFKDTSDNPDPLNDDDFPDFVVSRRTNVMRVFVQKREGIDGPVLARHTRPTGPAASFPGDVLLIQLPYAEERGEIWDIAALDTELDLISIQYGGENNLGDGSQVSRYPVPGQALAMAAGDLNGDRREDIVAATWNPSLPGGLDRSFLTVLIANKDGTPGVASRPLRYRQAAYAGENAPVRVNTETLGTGMARAPDGTKRRFIATEGTEFEVIILFIDEETGELLIDEETDEPVGEAHFLEDEDGSYLRFEEVRVADFDLDGFDEVLVNAVASGRELESNTLRLLENHPERGRAFRWKDSPDQPGLLVDFEHEAGLPGAPEGLGKLNLRRATVARIDPGDYPDVVIPVSETFLAVVLNIGTIGTEPLDVRFIETYDEPRHVAVTEIDGDGAPDLLVSNERSHLIHVLRGSATSPGSFEPEILGIRGEAEFTTTDGVDSNEGGHSLDVLLGSASSPGRLRLGISIDLKGDRDAGVPRIPGNAEFTTTDLPDPGFSRDPREPARVIVFSTGDIVGLIINRTELGGPPVLDLLPGQHESPLYRGVDAEFVVFEHIYPDDDGTSRRDIVIADEDRGAVVIFESRDDARTRGVNAFERAPREVLSFAGGRPDELVLYRHDGCLRLVSTTKGTRLALYEQSCEGRERSCTFVGRTPLDLLGEDEIGGPAGLTWARSHDGGVVIASLVEDGDVVTAETAADLIYLPRPRDGAPSPQDIGALESGFGRILLDGPGVDGILLGRFFEESGERLDLLVHDDEETSGEFSVLTMVQHEETGDWSVLATGGGAGDAGLKPMAGHVRSMRALQTSSSREIASVVTDSSVVILDPESPGPVTLHRPEAIRAAVGRLDDAGGTFAVFLTEDFRLDVVSESEERATLPRLPVDGEVVEIRCADLNGDTRDDIVIVTENEVWTLLAKGRLRFATEPKKTLLPGPRTAVDTAFLDANADGRTDLCIATSVGTVLVLPGDGRGGFAEDAAREVFVWDDIEAVLGADIDDIPGDEIIVSASAPGLFIVRTKRPE